MNGRRHRRWRASLQPRPPARLIGFQFPDHRADGRWFGNGHQMLYSPQMLDHFRRPRHAGELANSNAVAEASNPVCGDVIKLWLRVEEARLTGASFKAAGCPPVIACGSWLTNWISAGRTVPEALSLRPEHIETALEGLPEASRHAAQLAVDVLRKALGTVQKGVHG